MSEYQLAIGSRVVFVTKVNLPRNLDLLGEGDGYPTLSHWGGGLILATRSENELGKKTSHCYQVYWPKRKSTVWMRKRDLLTPEEAKRPSLPCEYCCRFTRIFCQARKNTYCSKCLIEHRKDSKKCRA